MPLVLVATPRRTDHTTMVEAAVRSTRIILYILRVSFYPGTNLGDLSVMSAMKQQQQRLLIGNATFAVLCKQSTELDDKKLHSEDGKQELKLLNTRENGKARIASHKRIMCKQAEHTQAGRSP